MNFLNTLKITILSIGICANSFMAFSMAQNLNTHTAYDNKSKDFLEKNIFVLTKTYKDNDLQKLLDNPKIYKDPEYYIPIKNNNLKKIPIFIELNKEEFNKTLKENSIEPLLTKEVENCKNYNENTLYQKLLCYKLEYNFPKIKPISVDLLFSQIFMSDTIYSKTIQIKNTEIPKLYLLEIYDNLPIFIDYRQN